MRNLTFSTFTLLALSTASAFADTTSSDVAALFAKRLNLPATGNVAHELIFDGKTSKGLDCNVVVTYDPSAWMGHSGSVLFRGESNISEHAAKSATVDYKIGKNYADPDFSTINSLIQNSTQILVNSTLTTAQSIDEGHTIPASTTKQLVEFRFDSNNNVNFVKIVDDVALLGLVQESTECNVTSIRNY